MTKTENKREEKKRKVIMPAGIRNKLVAAISMLMVASIMMVSSTYAWFTLSTAPEVKGITTNVGANGNLEMMLLNGKSFNSTEENLGVESSTEDSFSVKALAEANVKWGNLVDLSDTSYGLDQIVLNPARLNITKGADGAADTLGNVAIKAPSYGEDGRVIDINKDTTNGKWSNSAWEYADMLKNGETYDGFAGVRGLGVSSGITKQLSAYRSAKTAMSDQITNSKNYAINGMNANGQKLADILIKHLSDENATFTVSDLNDLKNLIISLQRSNNAAGEAIKQAVLAYSLSEGNTLTDEQVDALVTAVNAAGVADVLSVENVQTPDGAQNAITKWNANVITINSALSDVDALIAQNKTEGYTYTEIMGVVNGLIDKSKAKICGITDASSSNISDIAQYYADNKRIDIEMVEGSGIFADIAELIGTFRANIKVNVKYDKMGVDLKNVDAALVAKSDKELITNIAVGTAPSATGAAGTKTYLSDMYGYALDFGFRTNAAASNLQLQTEGVQRVYADGAAAATQGGGSYMQFSTANVRTFSVDELRALMSAIRVVFTEPSIANGNVTYKVLGIAAPAITQTENAGVITYAGGTFLKDGVADGATAGNANGLKVALNLFDYDITADGIITLRDKKEDATAITDLTQNVAKKISVFVYIDGDMVDNTMVANATTSMSGSLNLQFSSSATLKPMENNSVRQNGGLAGKDAPAVTYTVKAVAGAEYSYAGTTFEVKTGYTIYQGSDGNIYYSTDGATYLALNQYNYETVLKVKTTSAGEGG